MFTRILLAVDGTESGDAAVSFATALARQSDSSVRVVHVNELLVGGRGFASKTELESMEIVDEAVGHLRSEGIAGRRRPLPRQLLHHRRPHRRGRQRTGVPTSSSSDPSAAAGCPGLAAPACASG